MDGEIKKVQWLPSAQESFELGLSTTGSLLLSWQLPPIPLPDGSQVPQKHRIGIEVPPKQVEDLIRLLQQSATIRETLSATPPEQGAH